MLSVSLFHIPWIHNDIIYIHHIRDTSKRQGVISLSSENHVYYIQICHSPSSRSWAMLWEPSYLTYRLRTSLHASVYMLSRSALHISMSLFIKDSTIIDACNCVKKTAIKLQMPYEVRMEQLNTPRGAESCNVKKKKKKKKARGGFIHIALLWIDIIWSLNKTSRLFFYSVHPLLMFLSWFHAFFVLL